MNTFSRILALLLCLVFVLGTLASCNTQDDPSNGETPDSTVDTSDNETPNSDTADSGEDTTEEPSGSASGLDLTGVEPIRYTKLGEDYQYVLGGGNRLSKFMNEPKESFLGVCKYFEDNGYELYGYNEMGNLLAATYIREDLLMHIYWIGGEMNELAVVNGKSSGLVIPPAVPEITTGEYNTLIAQMRATENNPKTHINGMGYVIRLADGSFIIYDGGYSSRVDELWDTLTSLHGSEEDIIIRAWLLTHSHGDHVDCFRAFSEKYASKVTLERLLVSPLTSDGNLYTESLIRFKGAKQFCVHTGMVLRFCDVTMEILCTADEIYFDGESDDHNNSSIVSRVYKEGGKSVMILGDAGDDVSTRLIPMYGDYLKSDICQAAHHGVEDFTIEAYRLIRAETWFYPCNTTLYNSTNRDADVRREIREAEYTKNIFLHDARKRPGISLNNK